MKASRTDPVDIEYITFQRSALLEDMIIKLGNTLYDSLLKANRYDEVAALSELIGEFTLLASIYGEQTGRVQEDLGVSLNEAALLKLAALGKHPGDTSGSEWKIYADQTKEMLSILGQQLNR